MRFGVWMKVFLFTFRRVEYELVRGFCGIGGIGGFVVFEVVLSERLWDFTV